MLLKVGSKGDDVKKLQEKLGLTADGSFGTGTEKAVKEWQSKNGLTADGIVGEGTWSKMMGAAPVAAAAPVPSGGPMNISKLKGHVPDAVINQLFIYFIFFPKKLNKQSIIFFIFSPP